eukprot:scaffold154082_cov38-Attheya_sp.AAC.1
MARNRTAGGPRYSCIGCEWRSDKSTLWYQPAVKGTLPGSCNMHGADYVPARREVFVFGEGPEINI